MIANKTSITDKTGTPGETGLEWQAVDKWVRIYSWITWGAVIYGILAAHIPFIIGHPWSSCENCDCKLECVLAFHLFEVPLVTYNAWLAWYGLKRFTQQTVYRYMSLLIFAVVSNLAFFTFEVNLLLGSIHRKAPGWENLGLTSVSLILVGGAGLGIYVKQKLVDYVHR